LFFLIVCYEEKKKKSVVVGIAGVSDALNDSEILMWDESTVGGFSRGTLFSSCIPGFFCIPSVDTLVRIPHSLHIPYSDSAS
jgi:hypothetical protein